VPEMRVEGEGRVAGEGEAVEVGGERRGSE
jgi:hypothetical protein